PSTTEIYTLSLHDALPIFINAKFVAAIIVITGLFLCLSLLVTGWGILKIGILPTFSEFCRILALTALNVLYVSFWLNLSIYFSIDRKSTRLNSSHVKISYA